LQSPAAPHAAFLSRALRYAAILPRHAIKAVSPAGGPALHPNRPQTTACARLSTLYAQVIHTGARHWHAICFSFFGFLFGNFNTVQAMIRFRCNTSDVQKLTTSVAPVELFCGALDRETGKRLQVTKPSVLRTETHPVNLLALRMVM